MEAITISTPNHETYSSISNFFIDYYMNDASGEFVKIYLYLVRLLNSGRAITVAEIADHFNMTEKDICRAIRYWIKQNVLKLEYTNEDVLTGITILPLTPKGNDKEESLLSMLGIEEESSSNKKKEKKKAVEVSEDIEETSDELNVPEKRNYKPAEITAKKEEDDFGNLIYLCETYFQKSLTQSDLRSLMYICDDLEFPTPLVEYLIEHCVTLGKTSFRYIEAVAVNWYTSGITTVAKAKAAAKAYNKAYVSVLKELGINRSNPTPTETKYIDTWRKDFSFNSDIILEACRRTVEAHPQNPTFPYVNKILEFWHEKGVAKKSDIEELDKAWADEKAQKALATKTRNNKFNNYKGTTTPSQMEWFEKQFIEEINAPT